MPILEGFSARVLDSTPSPAGKAWTRWTSRRRSIRSAAAGDSPLPSACRARR
jgi:hypothetical protein